MDFLPLNVLVILLTYCDYYTLISMKYINKNFYKIFELYLHGIYRSKKLEFVKNSLQKNKFKSFFIKELNEDIILNLRYLNIKNKISYNGYIDFIEKKDFDKLNTNIVYGYDMHDRFFLSFLFYTKYKERVYFKILTIFQRYSNDENFYISCQDKLYNYPYNEKLYVINDKIYSFNEGFIKNVFSLLNNNILITQNKYNNYILFFDKR